MSSETTEESWWAGVIRPTMRKLILTWLVIVIVLFVFERNTRQQAAALQHDVDFTKSEIAAVNTRIQQGDTSIIAEVELMRKKVADFDSHMRLLSDHIDEAKSNQAVARAKVADLRRESSVALTRLQSLRKLVADWKAKTSGLMTGDSGRRIASSPVHVTMVDELSGRERPTEVELTAWSESLDALTALVESTPNDNDKHVITPVHEQSLQDLSRLLGKARDSMEQQLLLLDAILKETASQVASQQTLEQVINDSDTQKVKDLSAALKAARLAAEAEQTAELERLESELVNKETKRKLEKRLAEETRADQVAKAEQDRIAEETRLQEAKVRAQSEAIKVETESLAADQQLKKLEREFEKDLPAIRSLLSAFVSKGHGYRTDNASGPASLAFLTSQGALEPTPRGSYQMAFLANSGTRPPGGLKNPANADLLRRAQDLLNKYGDLMVQKEMLAP